MINEFEAPIPGQSLADKELGAYPWESPPDFADPDDAFAYFYNRVMEDDEMLLDITKLLELGAAPSSIAEGILFQSFTLGQVTPDVTVLLREPLVNMITLIGKEAGVDVQEEAQEIQRMEEDLAEQIFAEFQQERMQSFQPEEPGAVPSPEPEIAEPLPVEMSGLMAPAPMIEEEADGE